MTTYKPGGVFEVESGSCGPGGSDLFQLENKEIILLKEVTTKDQAPGHKVKPD